MTTCSHRHWIATGLAHALLADAQQPGSLTAAALRARAAQCLGGQPAWLAPLAERLARDFAARGDRYTVATLTEHVQALPELDAAFDPEQPPPQLRRWLLRPARMATPAPQLQGLGLGLPQWGTPADLAQHLGLPLERLLWLANPAQDFRDGPRAPAPHYHALLKPKRAGGLRLVEVPKPQLREVQRQLLALLLERVPAHEQVHGFIKRRSVLTHVREHAGQAVVIAFDLREFFNSIGRPRIAAAFRTLGYPEGVAHVLAALCTTRTPAAVRERLLEAGSLDWAGARRLAAPHLPQGAPTSPALANLCAFGLDLRLDGLAWRFGARYSRYADDLVFSGPAGLLRQRRVLQAWVEAIAQDEGFRLHPGKTRAMPQHARQQVSGVVVNQGPNLARDDYDRLRARLHRLAGSGCDAATRRQLQGQVAWACQLVAPARADKLRRLLAAVPG